MLASALVERWVRRRHPVSQGALRLRRRRLYILPTRFGALFGALLFVLFLWSVNYSNSLGFVLTFWLASVTLVAMWRCHNNLLGLQLTALGATPVFAGEQAHFRVRIDHADRTTRLDIALQRAGLAPVYADVGATGGELVIPLPAPSRGLLRPGRLKVLTRFPLGLFQAWSWVEFDRTVLVYPAPRGDRPLPLPQARIGDAAHGGRTGSGDDFSGLSDYRPGDRPRHVAWKASSRARELLVKRFAGAAPPELWLESTQLANEPREVRLEQLCRWVLTAEQLGFRYGLRLPTEVVALGQGGRHRDACLTTLACYELDTSASR